MAVAGDTSFTEDELPPVAEHRVHVFFPLVWGAGEAAYRRGPRTWLHRIVTGESRSNTDAPLRASCALIGQLSIGDVVRQLGWTHVPSARGTAQAPAWKEISGRGMNARDLYPHVRQILGGESSGVPLCIPYEFADLSVLNAALIEKGVPRRYRSPADAETSTKVVRQYFRIAFKAAAGKRLGTQGVRLRMDSARLYVFRSDIAVLDLGWHYLADGSADDDAAVDPRAIVEGNYLLSHSFDAPAAADVAPRLRAHDCDGACGTRCHGGADGNGCKALHALRPLSGTILRTVAAALLPEALRRDERFHPDRLYLYTAARFAAPVAESKLRYCASMLAHRFTLDYKPSAALQRNGALSLFGNVCHVLASESAASLVAPLGDASAFVQGFVKSTAENKYVPLLVAGLHTNFWLLYLTDWLPARRQRAGSRAEQEGFEDLYQRVVEFRRYFTYPQVSQISHDNAFYDALQDAHRLSTRVQFLEQTARDQAELIKSRLARTVGRISSGIAAFLLFREVLEYALTLGPMPDTRVWIARLIGARPDAVGAMVAAFERSERAVAVVSLLAGLFVAWRFSDWAEK